MNWLEKVKDFFASIPRFIGEVKAEMKKVSFPTRDEVVGTTVVVLVDERRLRHLSLAGGHDHRPALQMVARTPAPSRSWGSVMPRRRAAPRRIPAGSRQWYIVHTYSGFEERVKETPAPARRCARHAARRSARSRSRPRPSSRCKGGKKREMQRKFFPGYILVEMEMSDDAWHLVKNTPKVTGFVGTGKKPTPLTAGRSRPDPRAGGDGEGEAEAEARVRAGRAGPDHRRPVHQLHRRGRRGQPRPQHAEGHGHDLRPVHAGRARVPAGPEAS